jgi:bacterioferritin (cytochrome b1)
MKYSNKKTKKMQQGGVSGAVLPYYGEVGNLLSSMIGGVNSSPNFQPKQNLEPWGDNIANQYVEDIKKEMGLKKDPRFFGILGTRWVDANGNKYTEGDLKKMAGARYDSNKAGIKSYNEQLPLAGGMAMLFDIQQREADSAQNTKTNISDVEYSKASPWPAGFSMQQGGSIPTTQDSLDLYNNAVKVLNFYSNKNGYKKSAFTPIGSDNHPHEYNAFSRNNLGSKIENEDSFVKDVNTGQFIPASKALPKYYQKIDNYKYKQREYANAILNFDSPMQLFDNRINPQADILYSDINSGDIVNIFSYEPLLIKPVKLLTDKERKRKAELEKYYGISKKDTEEVKSKKVSSKISLVSQKPPQERDKEDVQAIERIKSLLKSSQENTNVPNVPVQNRNYGLSPIQMENIPNIKILRDQKTLEPKFYENELGQRIPYNETLTKNFQYPGVFQQGGQPFLGYKDISPYKNLPFQTFNTDTLTMDGVGRPLLAITDQGQRKVMPPNSGLHKFPGAKSIMEIPMAQDGGVPGHSLVDPSVENPRRNPVEMPTKLRFNPWDKLDPKNVDDILHGSRFNSSGTTGAKMLLNKDINNAVNQDLLAFAVNYADLNGIDRTMAIMSIADKDSPIYKLTTNKEELTTSAKKLAEMINSKTRVKKSDFKGGETHLLIDDQEEYKRLLDIVQKDSRFQDFITEMKNGGMIKKYKNGGAVYNYQNSYKKDLPVGNSDTPKGVIYIEDLIPIQAEKGELLLTPTGDVVPVNATKRHSQMDDDDVTDMAPANSYVFSKFGDVKIYKKLAEDITLQVENTPYNSFGKNSEPKTKTLADFMTKKVMAPADLVKKVANTYKVVDNEGDLFTEETNRQNKMNRAGILEAIVNLSELDKGMKGLNEAPVAFRNGGLNIRGIIKAQTGLEVAAAEAAASMVGVIPGLIADYQNRKLIKKNLANSERDINTLYSQQNQLSNVGLMANLMGVAAQNPVVDPVIYSSTYLDQMPTELPRQFYDYNTSRLYANKPNFSGYNPQVSAALMDNFYAKTQDAQSQYAMNAAVDGANRKTAYYQAKQSLLNSNEAARVGALNLTRANSNNLLATAAGSISGSMTDRQNLLSNKVNALLAARGQGTAGLIQLNSNLAQTITNGVGAATQAVSGYYNNVANQKPQLNPYNLPSFNYVQQPGISMNPNTGYNFFDTNTWRTR